MSFTTLMLALSLGQPPADPATLPTPATDVAQPEPPPPADGTALMTLLSQTRVGSWLEDRKISVGGWTDMSFTPSTASRSNLPLGFNTRANDFLLQQNWLRIDRPIDTEAKEATYGFRTDIILPGSDARLSLARGCSTARPGAMQLIRCSSMGKPTSPISPKGWM